MAELLISPFKRTRILQGQIQEFLDLVSKAAMTYEQGVTHYVRHGWDEVADEKLDEIKAFEADGDQLRMNICLTLYTEMLLPDTSGDVLGLLNDLDHLLDVVRANILFLNLERPQIPEQLREMFVEFVATAVKTVDQTVLAARTYFRDPAAVQDHLHKIHYHEDEAEKIAVRILKDIFKSDLALERKTHLRDHLIRIDRLADLADDAGDRLAIYAVKGSL